VTADILARHLCSPSQRLEGSASVGHDVTGCDWLNERKLTTSGTVADNVSLPERDDDSWDRDNLDTQRLAAYRASRRSLMSKIAR
jgi:hypothetical protein